MMNDVDFRLPGWKIEPKYSPKVLIGNWYEERMRTDRSFYDLNFNPRWSDHRSRVNLEPEVTIRSKSAMENDTRQKEQLANNDEGTKRVSGNYGLKEELEKKWRAQNFGISRGGLNTTYSVDYTDWPRRSHFYRMSALGGGTRQTVKSGGSINHSPENIPTYLHDHTLQVTQPEFNEAMTRYSRHLVVN